MPLRIERSFPIDKTLHVLQCREGLYGFVPNVGVIIRLSPMHMGRMNDNSEGLVTF
jgi:hypothetical protein